MARSENATGLHVTVSDRTVEFLLYLIHVRGTNLGKTPTGVATFIAMREIDKMIGKDPFKNYWRQGVGPKPPTPPP